VEQLIHVNTSELGAFRVAAGGSNWALLAGWLAGNTLIHNTLQVQGEPDSMLKNFNCAT
jgi:hypothetical protein